MPANQSIKNISRCSLTLDSKGRAVVEFEPGVLLDDQHEALSKILKAFLTDKTPA